MENLYVMEMNKKCLKNICFVLLFISYIIIIFIFAYYNRQFDSYINGIFSSEWKLSIPKSFQIKHIVIFLMVEYVITLIIHIVCFMCIKHVNSRIIKNVHLYILIHLLYGVLSFLVFRVCLWNWWWWLWLSVIIIW